MVASNPWLTAPAPLISSYRGESVDPLHVYLALHTSTGFSPLHSAVNYGTFLICLCLLYAHDHLSWTAEVFHEAVEKSLPRPSNQVILLTGILRALWDHDASDHPSSLCIHLPEPMLLRSLRSPPTTYSNEVSEWLHELAHLQASTLIGYDHVSPPKEFSPSLASAPLGMYFAQVYAVTGISPPPTQLRRV